MAKQNPGRITSLAALQFLPVQDEKGERLGHLFDLRAEYDPRRSDKPPVVTEITYGTIGFLERMGIRRARPRTIAWSAVVAVQPHAIVVRRKVKG